MSIDISPDIQARLFASAQAEGMSIDAFLERLIDEREEMTAAIERADAHFAPLSQEEIRDKIERGFQESEHGGLVDGDTFTAGLVSEMNEMERNHELDEWLCFSNTTNSRLPAQRARFSSGEACDDLEGKTALGPENQKTT